MITALEPMPDEVAASLEAACAAIATAAGAVPERIWQAAQSRMQRLLGVESTSAMVPPLPPAAEEFVEQFILDVSLVTDEQRAALTAERPESVMLWAFVCYALQMQAWLKSALPALAAVDLPVIPRIELADDAEQQVANAMDRFTRAAARLRCADPVVREVVRLRVARLHGCELCKSLRQREALEAGGDEALYDAIDTEDAQLSRQQRTAIRLTDALLFTPGMLAELLPLVDRDFAVEERLCLILDVVRNSRNKAMVAANIADPIGPGLTEYTFDEAGRFRVFGPISTSET